MNNAVFGKTMENVRKHRDINLVTTEAKKNVFSVRTIIQQFFYEHLLAIEMERT